MRKINRAAIVIGVALAVTVLGTLGVRAQQNAEPKENRGCSAATINCSGVAQLQPGPGILLEERLVIVDDGNEIRSMTSLPPPVMVTGVHKRIDTH